MEWPPTSSPALLASPVSSQTRFLLSTAVAKFHGTLGTLLAEHLATVPTSWFVFDWSSENISANFVAKGLNQVSGRHPFAPFRPPKTGSACSRSHSINPDNTNIPNSRRETHPDGTGQPAARVDISTAWYTEPSVVV